MNKAMPIEGSTVDIFVQTGTIRVKFTILKRLPEQNKYLLYAQERICIGEYVAPDKWRLSASIDLLELETRQEIFSSF